MASYSPNPTAAAQPAVTVRRSGVSAFLRCWPRHHDQLSDRTSTGIAAPKLTAELGIDPAIMGILFSAFARTYAQAQIPADCFSTALAMRSTTFVTDPVVAVYPVPRHGGGAEDAAAVPLRARH